MPHLFLPVIVLAPPLALCGRHGYNEVAVLKESLDASGEDLTLGHQPQSLPQLLPVEGGLLLRGTGIRDLKGAVKAGGHTRAASYPNPNPRSYW